MLALTLLHERFGEKSAKNATWAYLLFSVWYMVMTWFHLKYQPSGPDWAHLHSSVLFSSAPRLVIAGICAMFAGLYTNRVVFSWMSRLLGSRALWLRTFVALVLSQCVDTGLFAFMGLRGLVVSLTHVILVSLAIKVLTGVLAVPLVGCSKFWVWSQKPSIIPSTKCNGDEVSEDQRQDHAG